MVILTVWETEGQWKSALPCYGGLNREKFGKVGVVVCWKEVPN